MNTMEVLTLLLVVFEALSYIDNQKKHKHKKKRKIQRDSILDRPKLRMLSLF